MTAEKNWTAEWRTIAAGTLLTLSGSAIFYIMPIYLGSMMEAFALNPKQAGILSGSEFYAIALTSLLGPLWIHRFSWRSLVLFGAIMATGGHILTMMANSYETIIVARIITGLFGEGVLYAVSFAVLASTHDPDRSFGIALMAANFITAIAAFGSAVLHTIFDRNAMVLVLLLFSLIIFVSLIWIPERSVASKPISIDKESDRATVDLVWIQTFALVALAVWFAGPGGFYAFAERLASEQGLTAQQIANAFALSIALSFIGPMIPALLGGERFNRLWPIAISTIFMCILVLHFTGKFSAMGFTIGIVLFLVLWGIASVFLFGLIAALDSNGRISVLTPACQSIGLAIGPVVMGISVNGYGYSAMSWTYALFAAVSLLLFVPIVIRTGMQVIQQPK